MSERQQNKVILFCYGTLKRGDCRNHLLKNTKFIGNARTTPDFTLYSCGSFPAMVKDPMHRTGVFGELYEVDESILDDTLDAVEGVPWLYDRGKVQIESVDNPAHASIAEANTYIYQRSTSNLPHLGCEWEV